MSETYTVLVDAWIPPIVHHEGNVWWCESPVQWGGAAMSASAFSLRELLDRWRELCIFAMTPCVSSN